MKSFFQWLDRNKWFALALISLLAFAWMFRYEVVTSTIGTNSMRAPVAFVLDRWTGDVVQTVGNSRASERSQRLTPSTSKDESQPPEAEFADEPPKVELAPPSRENK